MRKVERRLRERIKALEEQLVTVTADRDKFRNKFASDFRWFLELLGKNQFPDMKSLIESRAKFMTSVLWWPW